MAKFERILDESLTRVLTEKESVDSVLRTYPQKDNQLKDSLEIAKWLSDQGQQIEPHPGFIASSQQSLISELVLSRLQKQFSYIPFRREGFIRRLAIIITLLCVVFFSGAGMILSGEDSLPGETFYPVKVTTENIWLALTLQPSNRAQLHLQFAQEHLIACAIVASQGRYEDAKVALNNYERHMAGAGRLIPLLSQFGNNGGMFFVDFNQRYLQDVETIQILLPGDF